MNRARMKNLQRRHQSGFFIKDKKSVVDRFSLGVILATFYQQSFPFHYFFFPFLKFIGNRSSMSLYATRPISEKMNNHKICYEKF